MSIPKDDNGFRADTDTAVPSDSTSDVLDRMVLVETRLAAVETELARLATGLESIHHIVSDTHAMIKTVEQSVKPAIESLTSGGLFSMLTGRQRKTL